MPGQQIIHHTQAGNLTQVLFKGLEAVAPIPPAGVCNLINKITSSGLFTIDNFMIWHSEIFNVNVLTKIGELQVDGIGFISHPTIMINVNYPVTAWQDFKNNMGFGGQESTKVMSDTNLQFISQVTNNDVGPINIVLYWWLLIGCMASQKLIVDTSLT